MSKNEKLVAVPQEILESIVGGTLDDYTRKEVHAATVLLKRGGYPFRNAMDWWHEQCAGYRLSDEDWQEIEGIVRSVYEE